jgi:ascorbate-specific PTS system EIIC-type component UlaA
MNFLQEPTFILGILAFLGISLLKNSDYKKLPFTIIPKKILLLFLALLICLDILIII